MATKKSGPPSAQVVGSHFVKQYYGEVLSKKPVELHRFYKDESTFCHASGSKPEAPVSGLAKIKEKIDSLGLGGASVDLGCGSVDSQPSESGGVLLMVTGTITVAHHAVPRQFVQTFFLAAQHLQDNDKHNYYVRNDIFRFLDVLPDVVESAVEKRLAEDANASAAEEQKAEEDADAGLNGEEGGGVNTAGEAEGEAGAGEAGAAVSEPETTPQDPTPAPLDPTPPAAAAAAPATDSTPAAASSPRAAAPAAPAAPTDSAPAPVPAAAAAAAAAPPAAAKPATEPAAAAAAAPPAPAPAAPAAPAVPLSYADRVKSWATVASGGAAAQEPAPKAQAPPLPPASSWGPPPAGIPVAAPAPASPPASASPPPPPPGALGGGGGGGMGGSMPPKVAAPAPKASAPVSGKPVVVPHHASPAVAASAAAAAAAAAAGNGEIRPATSLFVRKVDMTLTEDDMTSHFSQFGKVTGISMNAPRGYAFIDYPDHESVLRALSTKDHFVGDMMKMLVVEERHTPVPHHHRGGGRGRGRGDPRDRQDLRRPPLGSRGGGRGPPMSSGGSYGAPPRDHRDQDGDRRPPRRRPERAGDPGGRGGGPLGGYKSGGLPAGLAPPRGGGKPTPVAAAAAGKPEQA